MTEEDEETGRRMKEEVTMPTSAVRRQEPYLREEISTGKPEGPRSKDVFQNRRGVILTPGDSSP